MDQMMPADPEVIERMAMAILEGAPSTNYDVRALVRRAYEAEHAAPPLKLGAAKRVAEQAISEVIREPGERNMLLVIAALQGLIDAAQEADPIAMPSESEEAQDAS